MKEIDHEMRASFSHTLREPVKSEMTGKTSRKRADLDRENG
jgi:hypothetical protein